MSRKRNLLIIEAGFKVHKEFILKTIAETNLSNLYIANGLDKIIDYKWVDKYVKDRISFSYRDQPLIDVVRSYEKKKQIKFDGVLTWVETSVHYVNLLQHQLELPRISIYKDKAIRNKALCRKRLSEYKIEDTKFYHIKKMKDLDELNLDLAQFPMILKPTELMASVGVFEISSFKDLQNKLDFVLHCDFDGENLRLQYGDIASEAILEEYLIGDGYSIECVTFNGDTQILGFNKKITNKFYDLGNILNPVDLNKNEKNLIHDLIIKAHKAMGVQYGITHIELRMVNSKPKILEMNFRLGGDYIPQMLHQKTKLNLGELIIQTYTGEKPFFLKKQLSTVHAKYLKSDKECRILEIETKWKKRIAKNSYIKNLNFYVHSSEILKITQGYPFIPLGHLISDVNLETDTFVKKLFKIQYPIFVGENRNNKRVFVFYGTSTDLKKICDVEFSTWEVALSANKKELKQRLAINPKRYLIAIDPDNQQAVGFIYWVPVHENEIVRALKWTYFSKDQVMRRKDHLFLHRMIISISVRPDAPIDTAKILLQACSTVSKNEGIESFNYVVRLPNFHHYLQNSIQLLTGEEKMGISMYIDELNRGNLSEPGYSLGLKFGSTPIGYISDYFLDPASLNYGFHFRHLLKETL